MSPYFFASSISGSLALRVLWSWAMLNSSSTSPQPAKSHILLADDDDDIRDGLTQFLENSGYRVTSVTNGAALLSKFTSPNTSADLVITDVRMSWCDGVSAVERLRSRGWQLPVVVMSAFFDDERHERLSRLSNVHWLPKPLELNELSRLIEQLTHATVATLDTLQSDSLSNNDEEAIAQLNQQ